VRGSSLAPADPAAGARRAHPLRLQIDVPTASTCTKSGTRGGLPDALIFQRKPEGVLIVFVELKSRRGVASKAQKQARAEMLPAGAVVVDGTKRKRRDDGVAPFGCAVSPAMAARAARAMGRSLCRPASAAAARADGSGRAAGNDAGLARAPPCPQGGTAELWTRQWVIFELRARSPLAAAYASIASVPTARRQGQEWAKAATLDGSVPVDEHGRTCIARQVERRRLRGLTELASHHRSKIICLIVDEIVISTRKKPIGRRCAPGV
jgi:hypothetical protein